MELIAVILDGATSAQRFEDAKTLLSYGFASYALQPLVEEKALPPVKVLLGRQATVQPVPAERTVLLEKGQTAKLEQTVVLEEQVEAPVAVGDPLGTLTLRCNGETIAEIPLLSGEAAERLTLGEMFVRLLRTAFLAG